MRMSLDRLNKLGSQLKGHLDPFLVYVIYFYPRMQCTKIYTTKVTADLSYLSRMRPNTRSHQYSKYNQAYLTAGRASRVRSLKMTAKSSCRYLPAYFSANLPPERCIRRYPIQIEQILYITRIVITSDRHTRIENAITPGPKGVGVWENPLTI